MMLLTDFWGESRIRNEIGWGLLIFLSVVIAVNFMKVLKGFFKWFSAKIQRLAKRFIKSKSTIPMKPSDNTKFESHSNLTLDRSQISEWYQYRDSSWSQWKDVTKLERIPIENDGLSLDMWKLKQRIRLDR